jgi:hypothetical protein
MEKADKIFVRYGVSDFIFTKEEVDAGNTNFEDCQPYHIGYEDEDGNECDEEGNYLEIPKHHKYARQCECCGKGMNEGYIIEAGDTYCSDKCVLKTYTSVKSMDEFELGKDDSDSYWTTWDELDDDHYYDENGKRYETE